MSSRPPRVHGGAHGAEEEEATEMSEVRTGRGERETEEKGVDGSGLRGGRGQLQGPEKERWRYEGII
jgi:hypothetical protein